MRRRVAVKVFRTSLPSGPVAHLTLMCRRARHHAAVAVASYVLVLDFTPFAQHHVHRPRKPGEPSMHPRMAQAAARRFGGASRVTRPHARRHVRFVVSLPIRCARISARATDSWRGRTTNVSRGGLAVELSKRLPPATAVAVEIRTGIGPMRMEAAVVWTRHVAGRNGLVRHGLCFADRSELLDFPVGVLLGQWLQRRARQEPRLRAPAPRLAGGKAQRRRGMTCARRAAWRARELRPRLSRALGWTLRVSCIAGRRDAA